MIWWVLLTFWFTAAIAPAIAGISTFTELQKLGIIVTDYNTYLGDDPTANGRMAAGFVTNPLFRITDIAQMIIAACAMVVLVLTRGRPTGERSRTTLACYGIVVLLIAIPAAFITPKMDRDLTAYREAARAGQIAEADAHRAEFNTLHLVAERMYSSRALAIFAMVAASGFAAGRKSSPGKTTKR